MAVKIVEERLTVVEHKVEENAQRIGGLRDAIIELGERMDRRFESMEQRFDRRFEAIDRRFEAADRRFEKMEQTTSTHFRWIVGIQMTTLLAMVAAMAALAAAALSR